jgi:hypothetical protein
MRFQSPFSQWRMVQKSLRHSKHKRCRVTSFLAATLSKKWAGREGPIWWLPWTPNLTPLDFNFQGYIKDEAYVPPLPQSLREVRDRICDAVMRVNEDATQSMGWDYIQMLPHLWKPHWAYMNKNLNVRLLLWSNFFPAYDLNKKL